MGNGGGVEARARHLEEAARDLRVCDRDGECLWTLFSQPTIPTSIDASQALVYRSALPMRTQNLFSSPSIVTQGRRPRLLSKNSPASRDCANLRPASPKRVHVPTHTGLGVLESVSTGSELITSEARMLHVHSLSRGESAQKEVAEFMAAFQRWCVSGAVAATAAADEVGLLPKWPRVTAWPPLSEQ